MKVIKRNGKEMRFNPAKIRVAIQKACNSVPDDSLLEDELDNVVDTVVQRAERLNRAVHVEELQDMVIGEIGKTGHIKLMRHYSEYRMEHELARKQNTTDGRILSLVEGSNEEAKQENANKNPVINSTQRDYIAGEVSRDITRRILLPEEITAAHNEGIIHFHDGDYYLQRMHNCDLLALDDMLQNGTVISGTLIEKPHSFTTACTVATQIIAQVASNQYGLR
jgi:ribonucleoside-triphosphate reductase